jgi:hypothetical protein
MSWHRFVELCRQNAHACRQHDAALSFAHYMSAKHTYVHVRMHVTFALRQVFCPLRKQLFDRYVHFLNVHHLRYQQLLDTSNSLECPVS